MPDELTIAVRALPSQSVECDGPLLGVYEHILEHIKSIRKEFSLRMVRVKPEHVRLVAYKQWMKAVKESDDAHKVTVGFYDGAFKMCYVRNFVQCPGRPLGIMRAECASTIAHELMHRSSSGGFHFSCALNEGITEWLATRASINNAIDAVVGERPQTAAYSSEVRMWQRMRAEQPKAAEKLEYYYWRADSVGAQRVILDTFGLQLLHTLHTTRNAASAAMKLLAGKK